MFIGVEGKGGRVAKGNESATAAGKAFNHEGKGAANARVSFV